MTVIPSGWKVVEDRGWVKDNMLVTKRDPKTGHRGHYSDDWSIYIDGEYVAKAFKLDAAMSIAEGLRNG